MFLSGSSCRLLRPLASKPIRSHLPAVYSTSSNPGEAATPIYRTSEDDPRNLAPQHLGRLYTVPTPLATQVLGVTPERHPNCFVPTDFVDRCQLFEEYAMMVREPALELFGYMKQIQWDKSPLRFVLYGPFGCGKTVTLGQAFHFAHNEGLIVLHFHRIRNWLTKYKETAPSEWKEGRVDHILNSQILLKDFLVINAGKLDGLVTHQDYKWTEREVTKAGSPLTDVVEQGITRPKFAADCLNVLMKELKLSCNEDKCKLAVMVDGINCIFEEKSRVNRDKPTHRFSKRGAKGLSEHYLSRCAAMDDLSVIYNLKKLLRNDYKNAVVLATVCRGSNMDMPVVRGRWWFQREQNMVPITEPDYPHALLGQKGWESMSPFVPIEVGPYNESELDTMIDYYVDKCYIKEEAATDAGRKEIHFLTGRNPRDFFEYSAWW